MPPEEDDDFMFRYEQQNPDLSFGSEYDPSALDNFASFLSPTSQPGVGPALESNQFDLSKGFGDQVSSQINRQKGLLETQNEISLDKITKLQQRAATPNYELSPTEAFASSALAILPSIFGYAIGGAGVGAQATKLGAEGVGALIKNHSDSDTVQRQAALQLAQTEQQRYQLNNQRANTLSDRQFQVDQQNANREDTQVFQQGILGARKEQLTAYQQAQLEAQATKRAEELKKGKIAGVEVLDGYSIGNDEAVNKVRKTLGSYSMLETSANNAISIFSDPAATTTSKQDAIAMLVTQIKEARNFGGAFTDLEAALAKAGLPSVAGLDYGTLYNHLTRQALGQRGALDLLNTFQGSVQRELQSQLVPYNAWVPGKYISPDIATQYGIPTDELGRALAKPKQAPPTELPSPSVTSSVTPELLAQVGTVESGMNPNAVGPKTRFGQAKGAFQVLDSTGLEVHKKLGMTGPYDPSNPEQQLEIASAYLQQLLDRNGGDMKKALQDYNAGMGTMGKVRAGEIPIPKETAAYTGKVLGTPPSRDALEKLRSWKAGSNG